MVKNYYVCSIDHRLPISSSTVAVFLSNGLRWRQKVDSIQAVNVYGQSSEARQIGRDSNSSRQDAAGDLLKLVSRDYNGRDWWKLPLPSARIALHSCNQSLMLMTVLTFTNVIAPWLKHGSNMTQRIFLCLPEGPHASTDLERCCHWLSINSKIHVYTYHIDMPYICTEITSNIWHRTWEKYLTALR